MVVFDLEPSSSHDLCDEGLWQSTRSDLENGVYAGAGMAPCCGSFCANRGRGSGPRILRGERPPDLYGFKHLTPEEKETVCIGTCLALRCSEVAQLLEKQLKVYWWEQPKRRPGEPSMLKLMEIAEVLQTSQAAFVRLMRVWLQHQLWLLLYTQKAHNSRRLLIPAHGRYKRTEW